MMAGGGDRGSAPSFGPDPAELGEGVKKGSKKKKGSNLLLRVVGICQNPPSHVLPPMKYSLSDSLRCHDAGPSTKSWKLVADLPYLPDFLAREFSVS